MPQQPNKEEEFRKMWERSSHGKHLKDVDAAPYRELGWLECLMGTWVPTAEGLRVIAPALRQ